MAQESDNRPHIVLTATSEPKAYTAHTNSRSPSAPIPDLPRGAHGAHLRADLRTLEPLSSSATRTQRELQLEAGIGLQIQFVSQPNTQLAIQSLSNDTRGIELLSVVNRGDAIVANVFVPDGQLVHFENLITSYVEERTDRRGRALDHKNLINTIASIRASELRALWTDSPELLPADINQPFLWEVWLAVRYKHLDARNAAVRDFIRLVTPHGCRVSPARANFPERVIVWMFGSQSQLSASVAVLNCVAELRKAKVTADFFDGLPVEEQGEWVDALLHSGTFPNPEDEVPKICLLDTGVNRAHPLLQGSLLADDMHTVQEAWGVQDDANHGTGIAGLALYGDVTHLLESGQAFQIKHRLESVKLIDDHGGNVGDDDYHAYLFAEAVSRAEVQDETSLRVFNCAITTNDSRDRGAPSSWSSMVDSLAADMDNEGFTPRLFVQCAGNMLDQNQWMNYPTSLVTNNIHDPGQAWNAITVGAYTEKVIITEEDAQAYSPIATLGGVSPMSSTSSVWESAWPLKPDVVCEGGNAAKDAYSAVTMPSLRLLTTNNDFNNRLFTTTNATSAASAACSLIAANLIANYPTFRPETIRALIVHSANWTPAMILQHLPPNPTKSDYAYMIRNCGWGVPSLQKALWSASNSLTLVVEDSVQPYKKEDGKLKTNHMNLHSLPWPVEELEALGATEVEMRVTLSYFVEPNPSRRGSTSKFHYPSHRLRFDCRRPTESLDDFIARINAAAETSDDEVNPINHSTDTHWDLGPSQRNKGSLHQDTWKGTAVELAQRGYIGIYPAMGWWRTRPRLGRYNAVAPYTLIISIRTPETETDLYTAVQNKIANPVIIIT